MGCLKGFGHVPLPQKFTIASIACIGTFSCEVPLALLTLDQIEGLSQIIAVLKHPEKIRMF